MYDIPMFIKNFKPLLMAYVVYYKLRNFSGDLGGFIASDNIKFEGEFSTILSSSWASLHIALILRLCIYLYILKR